MKDFIKFLLVLCNQENALLKAENLPKIKIYKSLIQSYKLVNNISKQDNWKKILKFHQNNLILKK